MYNSRHGAQNRDIHKQNPHNEAKFFFDDSTCDVRTRKPQRVGRLHYEDDKEEKDGNKYNPNTRKSTHNTGYNVQ